MGKWNHLGLQLRIMAYVTLGLLGLLGALTYFDMRAMAEVKARVFRGRIALAQSLARDVRQDFEFLASDLRLGAEGLELPGDDFQGAAGQLYKSLQDHASSQFFRLASVSIMDGQGRLLGTAPPGAERAPYPSPEQVQAAVAQDEMLVLRSRLALDGSVPFASVVTPVRPEGLPLVLVAETVGVSTITSALPQAGTGYYMQIVLAEDGTVVSTSQARGIGERSAHYSLLQKYQGVDSGGVEIAAEPQGDRVVAVTPLPGTPFYLVLEQPTSLAFAGQRRRERELQVTALASVVALLGAAWYTTRKVVRPVKRLQATARAIAEGGLDTPVGVVAQDEVGQLAEDIEAMRRQLRTYRDNLEQANRELKEQVAERTQRLQETLGKVITAQEEERRRLARELHDEQSQALGALAVSLDRVDRLLGTGAPGARAELQEASRTVRILLRETRRIIYDLRPTVLDDMGLAAAIRWCAETHLDRHGIDVAIQDSIAPGRLPAAMEVALFRVAQEAIVNVERHSRAKHAGIELGQRNSSVTVRIWDDGQGFDPGSPGTGEEALGVGLEGMQERVRLIGGKMEISSAPGKGTTVRVEAPLD